MAMWHHDGPAGDAGDLAEAPNWSSNAAYVVELFVLLSILGQIFLLNFRLFASTFFRVEDSDSSRGGSSSGSSNSDDRGNSSSSGGGSGGGGASGGEDVRAAATAQAVAPAAAEEYENDKYNFLPSESKELHPTFQVDGVRFTWAQYDKRRPGLFKVVTTKDKMKSLCSKMYCASDITEEKIKFLLCTMRTPNSCSSEYFAAPYSSYEE
jgi:hypothetical protein